MLLRRVYAITLKEIRHIWRDKGSFFLVVFMPVMLLFMMAYMMTAELRNIPLAILDLDRSPTSRAFIQEITQGDDLDLYVMVSTMDEIEDLLLRSEIKAAIILPPGFENDLVSMRGIPMQVLIDGTEPGSGGFALEQIGRRTQEFAGRLLADQLQARGIPLDSLQPIDLRIRTWYNPNLEANVDMIPGLLSMVLGMPAMTVALTLAREREHGTFEQLLATPIGRAELLVGKMIPYVLAGLVNVVFTTVVAMLWFDVPFRGSFSLFMMLSVAFFFAVLSMGMIIGVFLHTQAGAMALSFLLVFLPGFFLTGIFFPISSMPAIVRMEAYGLPGTHYAFIARGVFTTGVGLDILWPYGLALVVLGILLTGVSALFFRKKLG